MARKFFYVCAGMLMLALSYHFGASTASAQFGGPIIAATRDNFGLIVVTTSGDAYYRPIVGGAVGGTIIFGEGLTPLGNFWSGTPVPTQHESWGQVKARYRTPAGGSVTPGADNK